MMRDASMFKKLDRKEDETKKDGEVEKRGSSVINTGIRVLGECRGMITGKDPGRLRQPMIFYGNFLSLFDYLMII